ncbi:aspartate kinase [Alicyclobacillus sp. SO9]|uniref:aspartate kinase n=1 Tax=Alicyclobacillus sp. SO9 TaxID=2665646 RepID=UPI0018E8C911|nr:aspartate kinase [Alicyclobacillus sp. SO9]QQE80859.1 aspartate kinase [Alicyclobacillus sp. SO9]
MNIVVQKFGGTSLATPQTRTAALEHVEDAVQNNKQVVVVVSAMGRKGDPYATDSLLGVLDESLGTSPRDRDMLMACGESISAVVFAGMLRSKGHEVTVLSGPQAGIITNNDYGNARILEIRTARILDAVKEGQIVVVTGFQGMTPDGDTTTLGRGGSDTSATALGVALDAEYVDIFTDVDGIMTADPRIVNEAQKIKRMTYTEICNLAYQGAKVIHPRAVEIAMQKNIPVRVRSTRSKDLGTLVTSGFEALEHNVLSDRQVTGVAHTAPVTQIQLRQEGIGQVDVFSPLAAHGVSLDVILVSPDLIMFTVGQAETEEAEKVLSSMNLSPVIVRDCAKISAVGAGMAGVPGVMARIAEALKTYDVQMLQSSDSHASISVIVPLAKLEAGIRALHEAFGLSANH